jgi:hypothetical protein
VVSQPFRLRAETAAGWREHVPDFLAVTAGGVLLADVRPRSLLRDKDPVLFAAAAAAAALAAGWRYAVFCGWRPHVMATLDALSSQRRALEDRLGLVPQLLAAAGAGPLRLDDLAPAAAGRPRRAAGRPDHGRARERRRGMTAGLVSLAAGARLMLDGAEWTVEDCWPQSGRVVLRGTDGTRRPATMRALVNDPGFGPAGAGDDPAGRTAGLEDLDGGEREQLHLRVAHLLEAETGFRSGSSLRALDGEPQPEYDPGATMLAQRRAAKAAELRALGPEQLRRLTGAETVSERTLRRWAAAYWRSGIAGASTGRRSTGAAGIPRSPSRSGRRSTRSGPRRCAGRGSAWRPGTG